MKAGIETRTSLLQLGRCRSCLSCLEPRSKSRRAALSNRRSEGKGLQFVKGRSASILQQPSTGGGANEHRQGSSQRTPGWKTSSHWKPMLWSSAVAALACSLPFMRRVRGASDPDRQEPGRTRRRDDHGADDLRCALAETEPDSPELHFQDTFEAGRGLCNGSLAALLCEGSPQRIRELANWRVDWARQDNGRINQVKAPGHTRKRCVYVDSCPPESPSARRCAGRPAATTRSV